MARRQRRFSPFASSTISNGRLFTAIYFACFHLNFFSTKFFVDALNVYSSLNTYSPAVSILSARCPSDCVCTGLSIDCSFRNLQHVPRNLPENVERLDLQGNNITSISAHDLQRLGRLRILQLMDNRIEHIDAGAFSDLVLLERLRLNNNALRELPDFLFASTPRLYRLDISHNRLTSIGPRTFVGPLKLRNLQLDNNEIRCLHAAALQPFRHVQVLTLNRNNLTTLPAHLFDSLPQLKVLRIGENRLQCDCYLSWLAPWLRQHINLALFTRCYAPRHLSNRLLAQLQPADLRCPTTFSSSSSASPPPRTYDNDGGYLPHPSECAPEPRCPTECTCTPGDGVVVDCRRRNLKQIPSKNFPEDAVEILLDHNQIERVETDAFLRTKRVTKIDLSNNQLRHIAPDTFDGLKQLVSLTMYGNKLEQLPSGVFRGLTNLQLLLLNSNQLKCIQSDLFDDLGSLSLLSLYDNAIESLPNGTFFGLKQLQILHLARNPLVCDCHLRWLAEYLESRLPFVVEQSNARCEQPERMEKRQLNQLKSVRFKCRPGEPQQQQDGRSKQCGSESAGVEDKNYFYYKSIGEKDRRPKTRALSFANNIENCPPSCMCDFTDGSALTVDCSNRELTSLPDILPYNTAKLLLNGNKISQIPRSSKWLANVPSLEKIDLTNNMIGRIDAYAFERAPSSLVELQLGENQLQRLNSTMFEGLTRLRTLVLDRNPLRCVSGDTFQALPSLERIGLNDVTTLQCGCHLALFVEWIRRNEPKLIPSQVGALPPTCGGPFNHPLAGVPLMLLLDPVRQLACSPGGEGDVCGESDTTDAGAFTSFSTHRARSNIDDESEDNTLPVAAAFYKRSSCPSSCQCAGTVVRCTKQNLKAVPLNLPLDTTELYLDVNDITAIPDYINRLTFLERLDLSSNAIDVLPDYAFANLTRLTTLILSFNKLQCIQSRAFFTYDHNHDAEPASSDAGGNGLSSLQLLSLHGNDLSQLAPGTFDQLTGLTHIALGSNPFYCDCQLRWLAEFLKRRLIEPGIASCAAAPNSLLKNGLLLTAPLSLFTCPPGFSILPPEVAGKCNICQQDIKKFPMLTDSDAEQHNSAHGPCRNGGTCHSLGAKQYECSCAAGFHGRNCEHAVDACYGDPCGASGTCTVAHDDGRFVCRCAAGYDGHRCERNIDDCMRHSCKNNATCVDLVQGYRCSCMPGYHGQYCEKRIEFCRSPQYSPCRNGATCIDKRTHYACLCAPGFAGDNCTVDIDECAGNKCQNGAECIDGVGDYACKCRDGYQGRYCEIAPMMVVQQQQLMSMQSTSPCENHDCKNGVCFQPQLLVVMEGNGGSEYECKCFPGFSGKRCEKLTGVTFNEDDSYVELGSLAFGPVLNITVSIASIGTQGVILYYGDVPAAARREPEAVNNMLMDAAAAADAAGEPHLAVELFDGRIRVSFDVGNHPASTMFSYMTVNNGTFRRLQLLVTGVNLTLQVDDEPTPRSMSNFGELWRQMPANGKLYFGGVPRATGLKAESLFQLRNRTSLSGCMKDIFVNGKPIDLNSGVEQHRISSGCLMLDNPDPCKKHKCNTARAKCMALDAFRYKCQCTDGHGGQYCELAPTCRKESRRQYIEENGCRSKKPVKISHCIGTCYADNTAAADRFSSSFFTTSFEHVGSGSCCTAQKLKKRRIKMICGGTTHTSSPSADADAAGNYFGDEEYSASVAARLRQPQQQQRRRITRYTPNTINPFMNIDGENRRIRRPRRQHQQQHQRMTHYFKEFSVIRKCECAAAGQC